MPQLAGRVESACGPMSVSRVAPKMFTVQSLGSNNTYRVSLDEGACQCPDFEYSVGERGGWCKHLLAAAIRNPSALSDVVRDETADGTRNVDGRGGCA